MKEKKLLSKANQNTYHFYKIYSMIEKEIIYDLHVLFHKYRKMHDLGVSC